MSAISQRLEGVQDALQARIHETLDAALAATVGLDPAWDKVLTDLGVQPLTVDERLAIQAAGAPNLKGALPVEVRRALTAIKHQCESDLRPIRREISALSADGAPPEGADDLLEQLDAELAEVVAREVKGYVEKARPQISTSSIFANALATTKQFGDVADDVDTKKCPCCGAARPEGTDMRVCAFCGNDLFANAGGGHDA